MASSEAELTLILRAKDLASREVLKLHGAMGKLHGSVGRVGSAFATLGKVGILAVITGIVAVIGFMGAATKAAADEQKNIVKLDAALRANVKGYKGNTDAIEAVIKKREALAFSDDDLRASLATLVTKYHNVAKAQKVQAVAMDVARLKGISLADASLLVSKGMDGNAKVLKQLGISLPKTATEQERLTAIQKKAAGQAEAYGKTAAGAQESFQIAVGDVVEDIGAGLIPIMTQAFTWLRTDAIPAVRAVIGSITAWMAANKPLVDGIKSFVAGALRTFIEKVQMVVTWIRKVVDTISSNRDAMNVLRTVFAKIAEAVGLAWQAIGTLIGWVASVVSTITSNKNVISGFATVWNILGAAINIVVGAMKWLLDNAGKVIDTLSHLKLPDVTGITDLIPHFATGGTVPGPVGQATMVIAHGGERVIRTGQGGDGGRASATPIIVQVDGKTLFKIMDVHGYRALQRAAPTILRS